MGKRPMIRVSGWAFGELKRLAAVDRRTVVAVVDGLVEQATGKREGKVVRVERPVKELAYEPEE